MKYKIQNIKSRKRDFTAGPVVKNLPCNAGDAGSTPSPGTKIPHANYTEAHVPQHKIPHKKAATRT